jgi:hypothetical protein
MFNPLPVEPVPVRVRSILSELRPRLAERKAESLRLLPSLGWTVARGAATAIGAGAGGGGGGEGELKHILLILQNISVLQFELGSEEADH